MRRYRDFEEWVQNFLKESPWNELLEKVVEVQESTGLGNKTPQISQGKVRDGLLELLSLQDMRGLDFDLLEAFKQMDGNDLQEIRLAAREKCIPLLREQIRRGNTFFLDADTMRESELTVLIPGILEARINEIRKFIISSFLKWFIKIIKTSNSFHPKRIKQTLK